MHVYKSALLIIIVNLKALIPTIIFSKNNIAHTQFCHYTTVTVELCRPQFSTKIIERLHETNFMKLRTTDEDGGI